MTDFFAIGTSHKVAPVEVRSDLAFAEEELESALSDLTGEIASEAVIVSTCNRTEIYVTPSSEEIGPEIVREWLRSWRHSRISDDHLFALHGSAAAHHLMEVASGIDSQVIGDIQIIGQVKEAFGIARASGAAGKVLTRLFETALRAGKRVKTETGLFTGAVSLSYVAVELARKIFYPLEQRSALVVGAGETGELTARSLRGRGVNRIFVANRTEERGRDLIGRLGFGEMLEWSRMREEIDRFDIVIVATGSRDYVLDYEDVRRAAERRSGETMLVVDLAVPRNVDPRVADIPNVFCKDLNDLNSVIEQNVERRREEIPKAEEIITDELDDFLAWHARLPITPVIADLRRRAEEIAHEVLEENRRRFSEGDFANVEKLVGSVVKRIIGVPMERLLESEVDPETARRRAEYVRELFGLNDTARKRLNGEESGTDERPQSGDERGGTKGGGEGKRVQPGRAEGGCNG